ncbi:hypothetical protein RRG08_038560 [Elysia crispata]|uniref:Uncharacterized protein n=1 Tax=Elysia crispata TaxID=231223 RepID=A0AAE1CY23_9GAST|nr:hypothetical protein RRG08_038560 [Elysia crispata]
MSLFFFIGRQTSPLVSPSREIIGQQGSKKWPAARLLTSHYDHSLFPHNLTRPGEKIRHNKHPRYRVDTEWVTGDLSPGGRSEYDTRVVACARWSRQQNMEGEGGGSLGVSTETDSRLIPSIPVSAVDLE